MTVNKTGCFQVGISVILLLWAASLPVTLMLGMTLVIEEQWPAPVVPLALVLAAGLWIVPFAMVALLSRNRSGWEVIAALASGLTALSGYWVLDAVLRAGFQSRPNGLAAFRIIAGILYSVLAARSTPWLAGIPRRSMLAWLGLKRWNIPTLWLSLALAALLTLPWPITGALGDRFTSLEILFQTCAELLPAVLLIWGLVFMLLTSTYSQNWLAGLVVVLLYSVSLVSGVVPHGEFGALSKAVFALPLALLLTELRAREGGIVPVFLLAFFYLGIPRLFVDPRDAIMQGIPELQHILGYAISWGLICLFGPALWALRRFWREQRDTINISPVIWRTGISLVAGIVWIGWLSIYFLVGDPGFTDDGFLIILEGADIKAAANIADRNSRIAYVYDTLVKTAEYTQPPILAELDRLGLSYRRYYLTNMVRVEGNHYRMRYFENIPGVVQVIRNPNVREYPHRIKMPYGPGTDTITGVQENLRAINADEAWNLDVLGEGIVVAGQDTGYDWTHPALRSHYRGWDGTGADHDYNWHDAWDDVAVPFDDDSHGTHTMGTVLGDDGGANRTGVAPEAQWIGCRNMRRGFGNPASYIECMEFFLAPYPHGGDPFTDGDITQAPHVINNSWGCPPEEGCPSDIFEPALDALRAAGIMMVVSAGNAGPACETVLHPPANSNAVFSVGATTLYGDITSFSSRGPVGELLKPDIAAPGASVRSSVPGGGYGTADGTSMAGPHVAGLVALLWSANPALTGDIETTERLICKTATPKALSNVCTLAELDFEDPLGLGLDGPVCACGGATGLPNNVYGCGIIDAEAAVQAALEYK
ncbi:MAG: S8 family serine peptidase [Anaerolineae bacterium]|nr:S8 family serine peptidase [Anaerolineae bacterium]